MLENAEKASLRAKSLTNQLLTFSRGGSPVKKTTNLAEIVKDATRLSLTGKRIKCDFSISENLWAADADKDQINQVVENIVLNAGQAAGDGGAIQVTCANKVIPTDDQPSQLLKPGNYVSIDITDDGPRNREGNPCTHLRSVFHYQNRKETDSDWPYVIPLLKKHSGVIEVKSRPGSGTTFSILIPAITNGSPAPLTTASSDSVPAGKKNTGDG